MNNLPQVIISPVSYDIYYKVDGKDQYVSQTMWDNPESLRYDFWTYSFFISRGFVDGDVNQIDEYNILQQRYYRSLR